MGWGEILPLSFIDTQSVAVIPMIIPLRRFEHSVEMIPELLQLGKHKKNNESFSSFLLYVRNE